MGYVPDWARASCAKGSAQTPKQGIVSKPIFHSEKQQAQPKLYLADGSESDPNWMAGENYGDGTTAEERVKMSGGDMEKFKRDEIANLPDITEPKETKRQSFGEAFKAAKDGSTFEWNGKQYKKEYASATKPQSMSQEQVERNDELWKKGTARGSIKTTPKLSSEVEKAQASSKATNTPSKRGGGMLSNQSGKEVKGAEPSNWSTPTPDTRTKEEKIKAAKGGKYVQGRTQE